jgi:hypothetical protein
MGTTADNSDISVTYDAGIEQVRLDLHLGIVLPRERFMPMAELMDQGRFEEAKAMTLEHCGPKEAEFVELFFKQKLIGQSKPAPAAIAAE